ncbi:Gfo/Idh/MocA family oxidoreductase [Pseudodesulfovibrio thermohalotolerans]|jgi:predicted dehydrogenase|uniref:Gfo/Idh/MocA family oxidoreductase n=1 Tax=Pseudodesulfovibrio thermohalotolerans TaxID=2880651 RepID=UPI002441F3C2|nr:Gfo/Idh/MocA family oxidoreductase [Pseudodesulfovibrio thermohalotolerans]WFS63562.1 Gfo/Idh/MocA family oxidoreductase [Pseudodesulfovibrio thermohalotolerans]
MMKVGVVGLGWMGRVHLRNYTEMAGVEVVGVVDVDPKAREEVEAQFGVKAFASLDELLAHDLDAMSICVPTSLHHETGLKVMDKGINAIIEKPLAATAAEGEELVAKAREKGVALMVGHVERFNPAVSRVKELVGDDVISIQIERVGPYPPRIQDVGVIKDLGSHDIDLIRYLTGSEFKTVYAVSSTSLGKHEDSALITCEMENGVLANITTNWVTPYKGRKINVACESKYIAANLITQEVKEYSAFSTYDKSYSVREWPLMFREPVKAELTAFLDALRNGTPVPITGEDGLEVLKTFERIFDCLDK